MQEQELSLIRLFKEERPRVHCALERAVELLPAPVREIGAYVLLAGGKRLRPLLTLTAPLLRDRETLRQVLDHLLLLFRDACALRTGSEHLLCGDGESRDASRMLAGRLTRSRLIQLPELTRQTREAVDRNANTPLLVTDFCARLRSLSGQ